MQSQLKKGILDICVLAVLTKSDSYGYKIIKDVSKIIELSESTLYPILKRLEVSNCLDSYNVEHNGRLRKYYKITREGHNKISEFVDEWQTVIKVYDFIKEVFDE